MIRVRECRKCFMVTYFESTIPEVKPSPVQSDCVLLHLLESQWRWNHRRESLFLLLKKSLTIPPYSRKDPF